MMIHGSGGKFKCRLVKVQPRQGGQVARPAGVLCRDIPEQCVFRDTDLTAYTDTGEPPAAHKSVGDALLHYENDGQSGEDASMLERDPIKL